MDQANQPKQPRHNQIIGQIAKRLIEAGKESRKSFLVQGREIMKYGYAPDHNFEYQKQAPNTFFKAKAALTSEAFAILGPYLFPQMPVRILEPRAWASPEAMRRTEIMSQLLNYTPKEMKLRQQCRRALIEAIGFGRGVLWTGRHPRTGLVWSMYDTVRNLITDPNARVPEERNWVARKRTMPRFEAAEMWPKAKGLIMGLQANEGRPTDLDGRFDWEKQDTTTDCVTIYEIYLRTGIHNFKGGVELVKEVARAQGENVTEEQAKSVQLDNRPTKVCISETGQLISIGDWETPFHEDEEFPCTEIDFLENPDSDWGVSPLASGIGYQRAINWVLTLMMGKYRFTSRTIGALAKIGNGLSQKDKDKVLVGADIEMLELPIGGGDGRKLGDFIQEFNWSHDYLSHGMDFLRMLEEKHQKATGLYEILYSGNTGTQMRSAQEAQMKERTSKSRIDDMKDQVSEWMSTLARKEALASRFHYSRDDVGAILGPQAADEWGFLVKPDRMNMMTWAEENMAAGLPPEQAIEMAQQQMSQAVSLDQWRKETDYSIEVGSMRRRDIDTKIDALREMMNQTVPTQLQSIDPTERAMAYGTMAEFYHSIGVDKKLVDQQRQMGDQLRALGMQAQMAGLPAIAGPGAEQEAMA